MATLNTKTRETLESILRKYNDSATPDGEKEACMNVFERKCKSNGVDPKEFKDNFNKSNKSNTGKEDFENVWNTFWRAQDNFRNAKRQSRTNTDSRKAYKRDSDSVAWDSIRWDMKEPIIEYKQHKGKRVILLSTLAQKQGDSRYGLVNFCIYSDWLTFNNYTKDTKFVIHSKKTQYFYNHFVVEKIWVVTEHSELLIYEQI